MGRLNRYILKKASTSVGGLVVFACCVLLMERLLRIFEIVTNSTNPASDATNMIVNLLPYYLGMAVPMALLLGTIITVDRLSKSSELTAALGAGVSLFHMTKPFLWLAIFLAGLTMFIEGYMQPVGRYNYRQVLHVVKQQSFTAALREGTFTEVLDRTFFAGTDSPDGSIGPIFIYEMVDDVNANGEPVKGYRITTAGKGEITIRDKVDNAKTGAPVLNLAEGRGFQVLNSTLSGQLEFGELTVAGATSETEYRVRGDDEREMTSLELFANRKGSATSNIDQNTNNAALHLRVSKAVLLILLPFIAVPFGLNYGRNPSSAGIFVGVVFLVSLQKALEFGQSLGAAGKIPPWLGIWGIIGVVAIFAFFLFWKSAYKMGQPPLTSFSHWVGHIKGELLGALKKLTRDRRIPQDV
ncbi:LptF/LptG family permease [Litorimonas sp. WD9-15]|uniref:LptF/LptG family permease n=1 Tax=Litorimonas sp. WD9-15 TaxID=3418716 RepID=UPI003CFEC6EA